MKVVRVRSIYGTANYLLFKEGRRFYHAITIDKTVKVSTVPKTEARFFTPIEYKGKPYPVARACRNFLRAGKALGITKKAKSVLKQLKQGSPPV